MQCVGWVLGLLALTSLGFSAAESATYLFELRGTPVGVVELRQSNHEFTYRSVHVLTRGSDVSKRERVATFDLTRDGPKPAAALLWKEPVSLGCVRALDELSSRESELCVDEKRDAVTGRWLGETFIARYGPHGELTELRLNNARFVRLPAKGPLPVPPDLFAEGLPLTGAGVRLRWVPPVPAVQAPPLKVWTRQASEALAKDIHQEVPRKPSFTCLDWAREYVRRSRAMGADAAIVTGVHVLRGTKRALPHAWVRVFLDAQRWADWDVALAEPVTSATHLPLHVGEPGNAGALWLELFSGRRQVERF